MPSNVPLFDLVFCFTGPITQTNKANTNTHGLVGNRTHKFFGQNLKASYFYHLRQQDLHLLAFINKLIITQTI